VVRQSATKRRAASKDFPGAIEEFVKGKSEGTEFHAGGIGNFEAIAERAGRHAAGEPGGHSVTGADFFWAGRK